MPLSNCTAARKRDRCGLRMHSPSNEKSLSQSPPPLLSESTSGLLPSVVSVNWDVYSAMVVTHLVPSIQHFGLHGAGHGYLLQLAAPVLPSVTVEDVPAHADTLVNVSSVSEWQ